MKNILLTIILSLNIFSAQYVFCDTFSAADESSLSIGGGSSAGVRAASPVFSSGDLFRMILVLVLVTALIYAVFHLLRKFRFSENGGDKGDIRILSSKGLGPGKALHVVEIAGRYFVIGASDNSVSCITELTEEEGRKIGTGQSVSGFSLAENLRKIKACRERLK